MSKYNDDEQIEIAAPTSGLVSYFQREGKAKLSQLTGRADVKAERGGLDVVAVLDVGSSMKNEDGKNLKTMQSALRFLIKKLTPDDRLSVVTFPRKAERMFPLRWMTASAQAEIGELVDSLKAEQVLEGLLLGKQVLDGRRLVQGRAPVIMLMSDVEDDMNGDDKSVVDLQIPTTDVPVFTYGFGVNVNVKLLLDIAKMSNGGTFSYISHEEDLNNAFSFVPELTKSQSEKKLEIKSSADQKGGVKESTEIVETVKSGAKKVFKIMTDAADSQKKSPAAVDPDKDVNVKSLGTYATGLFSKPAMNITLSGTRIETPLAGASEKKPECKTVPYHGLAGAAQKDGAQESAEIVETMKDGAKKVFKFIRDAADAPKQSPTSTEPDKDANTKSTGYFSKPWMSMTLSGTKTETKPEIKEVSHQSGEPSALSSLASLDRQRYAATSDTSPDEEANDGKNALMDATTELNKLLELMKDAGDAQKISSDSSNPDKDVKVESLGSGTPTKTQQSEEIIIEQVRLVYPATRDNNMGTATNSLFATPGMNIYLDKINTPQALEDEKDVLEPNELPSDKGVEDDPFEPFVKSLGENHQKAIQILKLNDNVFDSDNTVQVKDLENIVANVQIAIQSLRQMQDTDIKSLRQLLET
ncbi:uncharacterized protein LOC126655074 [Mercurialis annua]|uniref:uncharacterized protein LOC126655074 n=1 Tax=Mercurialis annua TaxID=3986 RepID=UPI00215E67AA|nr:uncharacterized protein LOC126655074 [Mercurialis annua]